MLPPGFRLDARRAFGLRDRRCRLGICRPKARHPKLKSSERRSGVRHAFRFHRRSSERVEERIHHVAVAMTKQTDKRERTKKTDEHKRAAPRWGERSFVVPNEHSTLPGLAVTARFFYKHSTSKRRNKRAVSNLYRYFRRKSNNGERLKVYATSPTWFIVSQTAPYSNSWRRASPDCSSLCLPS